ncbi:MAG: 5-formyltetrahydrofolate cyclo-ligase [Gammaproteobacteria bacterium]|nr:5-formyltetrahydrofolate cyclo-ligase [Gammaproteobacteria bacterium]
MPAKPEIRRQIRRRRRALSPAERQTAAARITAVLGGLHFFSAARRIAVFAANDGEIDPGPAMRYHTAKQYYLPVLPPDGRRRMRFARVGPETTFGKNRYGIPEPVVPAGQLMTALELDLVLAPLVAFDREGGRLGMGGGYYDETFAFLASRERWHRPKLVGVAFSFQEVPHIDRDPWDIPLSAVVTERGVVAVAGNRST